MVEHIVPSKPQRVEGETKEQKRGLKPLSDDVNQRQGEQHNPLNSVSDASWTGYTSTLQQWAGKTTASVVYDSTVDEFTDEGLFQKVSGLRNVAIVATTTDGDVFGGFYSVAVTKHDTFFEDPKMFIFSFESRGRCKTPQRFESNGRWVEDVTVEFFKKDSDGWFVSFGCCGGGFYLGNEMSDTFCNNVSWGFENIEDTTLTGTNQEKFTCARLVAIRLE